MDIIDNVDRYNSILKDVKVIKDGDSFYLKLKKPNMDRSKMYASLMKS